MNTNGEGTVMVENAVAVDEIVFKNRTDLQWAKMLPDLGEDSPLYSVLRVDARTGATTITIQFPRAIHIPRHTHEKSETHIILDTASGERFDVREHGYIYMPGQFVHEAWVPAGSKAVIILEDGWKVDWLQGPPTSNDLDQKTPEPITPA